MSSTYDSVNSQLIVGRPAENIVTLFRPAAETYSVAGRVMTADGRGLRNASVRLTGPDGTLRTASTSSFGYYTFENVNVGGPYTASVSGRRGFGFPIQVITVNGNLTDVNFIAAQ
jgi:Carboxypeptidase regulatory-like domain